MNTIDNTEPGVRATRPRQIVTLVHGTWAPDADWVKPDSKLCRGLSGIDAPPIVRSFRWSGRNSHRARLQASADLARQLGETVAEFPDAEHHLIAHSHGGNVALYALRDPALHDHIASVICLATPFIHARARPLEPAFMALRTLTRSLMLAPGILLAIVSLLFAVAAAQADSDSPFAQILSDAGLPWTLVFACSSALAGFLIWGGLRIAGKLNRRLIALFRPKIEHYQQVLVNDYGRHAVCPLPILNAQVERDEPAIWLRALRWASEPQADARAVVAIAAIFSLALGAAFVWKIAHDPAATASFFSMVFYCMFTVVSMFLVWLIMLVLGTVMAHMIFVLVPFIVRGHGGGFGEWSLVANWLAVIEARSEPAGCFRVDAFRIAAQGRGLRHSRVYEDDRVITCIGKWLTGMFRASEARKVRR